jgi:hypothetical protein
LVGGRDAAVGEESGGVTGALLETRSGGRFGRPRRNGSRDEAAAAAAGPGLWLWWLLPLLWSRRVGLGKLDDAGLAW